MSTIRKPLRQTLVLGATAGIAALAMSLADPAAASCRGCSSGHHFGPAPSFRHATQAPTKPKKRIERMAQVPAHTFDPGGTSRPQRQQSPNVVPANFAPSVQQRGSVDARGRSSDGVPGGSNTSGGGSNTYVTTNGPSPTAGGTTPTTGTSPAPNLAAARICVLPAGSWCSITQGDVGMKCHCTDNNSGRVSEGIVK